MDVVLGLVLGAAVALIAYSLMEFGLSEERQVSGRLRTMTTYEVSQARDIEPLLVPFSERIVRPIGEWLAGVATSVGRKGYVERLTYQLEQAGRPRGLQITSFMAVKATIAFIGVALVVLGAVFTPITIPALLVRAAIVAVAGFYIPDVWLKVKVERRQDIIRRTLPDMIDMLVISVEAGLGFDQAVTKLIRNSEGPLAEEFGRMLQEVQAGATRRDALHHLSERVKVPELSTFVMAMQQADQFGISVSQVLRNQARELRVRRRQYAETQAQKAPVKIVFPLVFCILPATLIVVGGPAIVSIGVTFGILPA